jgi:hypothetical protein
VILSAVLYRCEKLSLKQREEHGVFENRVLRKIFGPNIQEVTADCRTLCNEEFRDFYFSSKIWVIKSRGMIWAAHVARMGKMRNTHTRTRTHRVLMGKAEGKETAWKAQTSIGDDIKMDLKEIVWDRMSLINVAQDRDKWWIR